MQPEKTIQSGAAAESATTDAVPLPVHEAGMANAAQRGAAYYNPGMYHELDLPRMGAGHGVDILGGIHRSPANDPGADLLGLGVLRPAAATNDPGGINYNSGAFAQQPGLGGGRNEDLLGVLRRADPENLGAVSYNSDSHADKATGVKVAAVGRNKAAAAGTIAGQVRRFLPFMGLVAASSAVTGLAAGTATPAAGFGLFVLLLGGLSLVTLRVLGAY